jgi:4-hydroxy-4-methyl-2-oxoglutarate aldolase
VTVVTGDWLVGDADGVVAVGWRELDDVIERGERRAANERELEMALAKGANTVELLGLDTSVVVVAPGDPAAREAARQDTQ